MKSPKSILFIITIGVLLCSKSFAQCPTVTNNVQTFCDLDSLLVSDLLATDEGEGLAWFESLISSTPISNSESLINGQTYYADNLTGSCGNRQAVLVNILGPPVGLNFQGVCVENASEATLEDLEAIGNDVQWYLSSSGGTALNMSTILTDNTIYYADQSSSLTGCRTSRLSVFVNVGVVDIPIGDSLQEFCITNGNNPTVGDLVASGINNWYLSISSALPLEISEPLIDGQTYYATSLDPPCESDNRLAVTVNLIQQPNPGENSVLDICETDTNIVDLFDNLGGTPDTGGTWSPALASGTGVFDPTIDTAGVYTYTVSSTSTVCEDDSATVTVTFIPPPLAGTDGTLDICENDTNTVDLFDNLGGTPDAGGTWSPALASGTGIYDPAIDAPGTYTYTVSGSNPVCEDATATVTVTFIPPPTAGTDGILDICENDTDTVDLFDSLGGTPDAGGTWSPALASGTSIYDPAIDSSGTYTYTVSSANPICDDASASVTITVIPTQTAGTDGTLDICENDTNTIDLFDNLGGTPDAGGTWSPALASGTGIYDPAVDSPGTYTYTVSGSNPVCEDATATVTVTFIPPPLAGTDGTLDICENDTDTVDLFDSLGGTPDAGGTWSPALASGTGIYDPAVDSLGTYTYTVSSANPICDDASASVTITVIPTPTAGTDGTLDICENDSDTVDLFDNLGGTPDTGGTWSPALASGSGIFDPILDLPGTYTYTVSSANPVCDDASASVTITVIPTPTAGTDGTLDICENDTNTIDLFDNLGGTPDTGGTWSPALASGTGIFDPAVDSPGTYTYTVSGSNPVCEDATATVTVTFIPPPLAGTDGTLDICENDTDTVDLFDSLGGTPDAGGTWSPALASGSGIFDPGIDSPGTYTYTVSSANPICDDASASVTITVIPTPTAGTDGTLDICENDTNTVDLFDNLGGTPDAGGTWSPALASGSGIFDPAVDSPGTYTYTVSSANPICDDASASVTITVIPTQTAGTDGTLDICENDTNTVDLFDNLGGTPDAGGTWSPALASGTGIFDPAVDSPGTYTYTVSSANPICDDASASVTITVIPTQTAGTDGTLDICENDTNTVDLFDNLGGTPDAGGTWSPALASGTGIFDPAVDSPGTYTYTVSSANPICEDDSATVTVTVIPTPTAGTDGTLDICENDSDTVDLFDSLGGTPDAGGTWSPALASGSGIFDPILDLPGTYTYTVSNTISNCEDASANVLVNIFPSPSAGTGELINICENDTNTIDLFDNLGGTPDAGGTWSPALASGTSVFDPSIDSPGTYTYTVSSANVICEDAFTSIIINLISAPDAGEDSLINLCLNDTETVDLFSLLGGTPDAGGTWTPILSSGTGVFDPSIDTAGIFTYTVTSNNSLCNDDSATIVINLIDPPFAGTNGTLDICENDSSIYDLFNNLGGTPDTNGTWSPALASGTSVFDPSIDSPGTYTYTVVSGNTICEDVSANVIVSFILEPTAGTDGTLDICENDTNTLDLFDSLGGTPDIGGIWSPALDSGSGIFDPTIDTAGVYTYTVNQPECNLNATSEVVVTINDNPNVNDIIINVPNICVDQDAIIVLSNMDLLLDGNYSLSYDITGPNNLSENIVLTIADGGSSFSIPSNNFLVAGTYDLSITMFFDIITNCQADIDNIASISFEVFDAVTPELIENGNFFCPSDNATIQDLSNNIITNGNIEWFNASIGGVLLNENVLLEDGMSYFASITTVNGCSSIIRLEVIANIGPCDEDIIIPDGFSPNDDGINDTFIIKNLEEFYPNYKLSIYNRNGNKLYVGDISTPKWDGTTTVSRLGGGILPTGVYFYILEFNDSSKNDIQGRVYLSR